MICSRNILICCLLCGCATSYRSETEGDYTRNKKEEAVYYDNLASDTLTKEDLEAFEEQALRTFGELLDYLTIAADPSYDSVFRNEAQDAAIRYILTQGESTGNPGLSSSQLNEFLKVKLLDPATLSTGSIHIGHPLSLVSEGLYQGRLNYTLKGEKTEKTAEIYLVKVNKMFGKETQEVWEVRFGRF